VIRAATEADGSFLQEMLTVAADWRPDAETRPPEVAMADPALARYLAGWDDERDVGFVAEADGRPVGAVWWRFLSADCRGYGFVDESVPELSIGVVAHSRGRGIGAALLAALVDEARRRSLAGLSLSVEPDNPAVVLYERFGFVTVGGDGGSLTMYADLS
jgi:GNAT superfamily N-acetyltransferase